MTRSQSLNSEQFSSQISEESDSQNDSLEFLSKNDLETSQNIERFQNLNNTFFYINDSSLKEIIKSFQLGQLSSRYAFSYLQYKQRWWFYKNVVVNLQTSDSFPIHRINDLQTELEKMLSHVTIRSRILRKEANTPDPPDKSRKRKGKHHSVKKKKDQHIDKNAINFSSPPHEVQSIMHHSLPRPEPMNSLTALRAPHPNVCGKVLPDNAQPTDIKNEATSKFWAFVEPYVAEFVPDDLSILDELITKYESEDHSAMYEIPPLGKLFVNKWGEDDLNNEKKSSSSDTTCKKLRNSSTTSTSTMTAGSDQENVKDILNMAEQMCSSDRLVLPNNLVERIVGALVDPDLFPDDTKNNTHNSHVKNNKDDDSVPSEPKRRKMNDDENNVSGIFHSRHNVNNNSLPDIYKSKHHSSSNSLDSRIRNGLEEQFKYKIHNNNTVPDDQDEILSEIHKCQDELRLLCKKNKDQLELLRWKVQVEIDRQEKKKVLKDIEDEVLEITEKYTSSRKMKREPGYVARDLNDGRKFLQNRRFKLNEEDTSHIYNILQKRTKALNQLHGNASLKC